MPTNPGKFVYDYQYSKFIECNRTSADIVMQKYPQNIEKNKNLISSMMYIRSVIEGMRKPYWLMSGTVLGNSKKYLNFLKVK